MDASCKVCHNNVTSTMPAIFDEFKNSAHSLGTYYNRGGECAACHNTEGFLARIDYTSASDIYSFSGEAKSAISCYTCHNIHTDYEASDFSLTHAAQVTETIFGTKTTAYAGSFADYGNGNLFLQCHQAPASSTPWLTLDIFSRSFGTSSGGRISRIVMARNSSRLYP